MAELNRTIAEFNGDPARLYLTDSSMGATGAYRIAYRWPDKFAAVVAVAGRVESGGKYTLQELETGQTANPFLAAHDPFAALVLRIKNVPIWLFHGDQDQTVPIEQSRKLVMALKRAGGAVQYTEYHGATHVAAVAKAYTDLNIIGWLLKQHR